MLRHFSGSTIYQQTSAPWLGNARRPGMWSLRFTAVWGMTHPVVLSQSPHSSAVMRQSPRGTYKSQQLSPFPGDLGFAHLPQIMHTVSRSLRLPLTHTWCRRSWEQVPLTRTFERCDSHWCVWSPCLIGDRDSWPLRYGSHGRFSDHVAREVEPTSIFPTRIVPNSSRPGSSVSPALEIKTRLAIPLAAAWASSPWVPSTPATWVSVQLCPVLLCLSFRTLHRQDPLPAVPFCCLLPLVNKILLTLQISPKSASLRHLPGLWSHRGPVLFSFSAICFSFTMYLLVFVSTKACNQSFKIC